MFLNPAERIKEFTLPDYCDLYPMIPIIGMIPSAGLAVYAAAVIVEKIAKTFFKLCIGQNSIIQKEIYNSHKELIGRVGIKESAILMRQARDCSKICVENLLNVATVAMFFLIKECCMWSEPDMGGEP